MHNRPSLALRLVRPFLTQVVHAGGIKYLLRDEFNDTLAAGSVNGTAATPGPGTRAVADTTSKLSIGSGLANIATGGPSDYDPRLVYASVARAAGKLMVMQINPLTGTSTFFGFFSATTISSTGQAMRARAGVSQLQIYPGAVAVTPLATSTDYRVIFVLRSTGGYYFAKGGVFTYTTLLWVDYTGTADPLYPELSGPSPAQSSYMRIPDALWLPTPLCYDTFTRVDGALAASEEAGPDSQAITERVWTGSKFTVSSNKAICTPTSLRDDVIINGGFDADTDWTKGTGWSIGSGVATKTAGTAATLDAAVAPVTAKRWYKANWTITRTAGESRLVIGNGAAANRAASGTYTETKLSLVTSFKVYGDASFAGTVDDISCQEFTLAELLASVSVGSADVLAGTAITWTAGYQAGIVARLDSDSSPANFLIAYLDKEGDTTYIVLQKCVAGNYTSLISASFSYSAGARLVLICSGSSVSVYYNNAQVGTTQTVSDAGILNNTLHGLFSTDPVNTFDNFLIMPRGTGNEYGALDKY